MVGTGPEHVDPNHDADWRQHLSQKHEDAVRLRINTETGYPSPRLILRQGPDANQCEQQNNFFKQRIERTVDEQNTGDRIAKTA